MCLTIHAKHGASICLLRYTPSAILKTSKKTQTTSDYYIRLLGIPVPKKKLKGFVLVTSPLLGGRQLRRPAKERALPGKFRCNCKRINNGSVC